MAGNPFVSKLSTAVPYHGNGGFFIGFQAGLAIWAVAV